MSSDPLLLGPYSFPPQRRKRKWCFEFGKEKKKKKKMEEEKTSVLSEEEDNWIRERRKELSDLLR